MELLLQIPKQRVRAWSGQTAGFSREHECGCASLWVLDHVGTVAFKSETH